MTAGAFVLAISAIFATKANKKFSAGFKTAFANNGSGDYIQAPTAIFTTVSTGATQVYLGIMTNLGTTYEHSTVRVPLYSSTLGTAHVLYIK